MASRHRQALPTVLSVLPLEMSIAGRTYRNVQLETAQALSSKEALVCKIERHPW